MEGRACQTKHECPVSHSASLNGMCKGMLHEKNIQKTRDATPRLANSGAALVFRSRIGLDYHKR